MLLRLPGGFQGLFWVTVVALEYHVVGKTLAFCPVSLWLQKRKTLVSTHRAMPLSPYMEVFAFWLPEDLSQENWCWGPGCGITKTFAGPPRACPWINVCWTGFEVSCSQCYFSPVWMFTFPLVFRRDWWKQKPKLFPWRMHPSYQRVPYRKGTGYGLATWTPKLQSKLKSSWFITYKLGYFWWWYCSEEFSRDVGYVWSFYLCFSYLWRACVVINSLLPCRAIFLTLGLFCKDIDLDIL